MNVEWFIALRYLKSRRQEKLVSIIAVLSFIGIMLGVATLIIVTSVMNGFHKELLGQILGVNGHLRAYDSQHHPILQYDSLVKTLKEKPYVIQAHPIIERQVLVTTAKGAAAVIVHGMQQEDLWARKMIADQVKWGSAAITEPFDLVIGKRLAEKLGVLPGDSVTVVLLQGMSTPFGLSPRSKTFRVKGVFEMGMIDYDSAYVFMSLQTAQPLFNFPQDSCSNIEILTNDLNRAGAYVSDLMKVLPPSMAILDWQKANTGYFQAIKVEKNVMFVILTLIVLVAAFNVVSGLIMLIKDKSQDIAVLKTIGLTNASILKVFLFIGASIGSSGTVIGGALGCLFSLNIETVRQFLERITGAHLFQAEIYFLSKLPSDIDIKEVVVIVVISMGLTLLAAFYPAWRASRLDPVETLRLS